ncbi:MAG: hypothetical protein ACRCYV_00175 [Aeromonas sp.]
MKKVEINPFLLKKFLSFSCRYCPRSNASVQVGKAKNVKMRRLADNGAQIDIFV